MPADGLRQQAVPLPLTRCVPPAACTAPVPPAQQRLPTGPPPCTAPGHPVPSQATGLLFRQRALTSLPTGALCLHSHMSGLCPGLVAICGKDACTVGNWTQLAGLLELSLRCSVSPRSCTGCSGTSEYSHLERVGVYSIETWGGLGSQASLACRADRSAQGAGGGALALLSEQRGAPSSAPCCGGGEAAMALTWVAYRVGYMFRETGQALERLGCRMQGSNAYLEDCAITCCLCLAAFARVLPGT